MATIPPFDADGLLPPSDYELSLDELRQSILVSGPGNPAVYPSWDQPWRERLVNNLEILTRQLWQAGIREIFADGSFAEFCYGDDRAIRPRNPGSSIEKEHFALGCKA